VLEERVLGHEPTRILKLPESISDEGRDERESREPSGCPPS
jgi:hypothetical protein